MSTSYVAFDISGYWEGNGIEVRLNRETNEIDQINLTLKRYAEKYDKNIYRFIDALYLPDGTLYYGPTNLLVNTDGNIQFIFSDDYGTGIDNVIILNIGSNREIMRYSYNINGVSEELEPIYKSLNGSFDLSKKTPPTEGNRPRG
jgi:hypothetical protein